MNEANKPARILVVDDDERNRRLFAVMLEAEGYSASEAADGTQALELARQSPPDIILLDIMMPGMDGYEVARALKADAATKAIPVVMVTALDDRASRLRGLEAGAEEFVTKPVDRNELRIRVRNLLRLREFSDHLEQLVEEKTAKLEAEIVEKQALLTKLQQTQSHLVQVEKMAAIGLLATGVAHEINNPASYIYSNLVRMNEYCRDLVRLLDAYRKIEATLPAGMGMGRVSEELEAVKQQVNPARVKADLLSVVSESLQGIERIIGIVSDLKEFSHVDSKESWQPADINKTLDTTVNVIWNELKYKAEVRKEYGVLPPVTCLAFQLNQVFMNLLVNAAQAIEGRGIITIRTGAAGQDVWVEIADTGVGIPKEHLDRIFEPFFTTKPVGKGTGLGLWISLGVVQKHCGRIEVVSEVGKGTAFKVWLPIHPAPGA